MKCATTERRWKTLLKKIDTEREDHGEKIT